MKSQHGRRRVVSEDVDPQIDGGRHAIRRIAGDEVLVTAAIYADGKDELAARLQYRHSNDAQWRFVPMQATGNDLWSGAFHVDKLGVRRFTLLGWVDHFASWASDLKKRIAAQNNPSLTDASQADRTLSDVTGDATANSAAALNSGAGLDIGSNPAAQDIALALSSGAALERGASRRARGGDAKRLQQWAQKLEKLAQEKPAVSDDPCDASLYELMARGTCGAIETISIKALRSVNA